jgi:hypothetical protein
MKRLPIFMLAFALAFIVLAPMAHATLLTPGQCVGSGGGCSGTIQNFNNASPGTVIASTGVEAFTISTGKKTFEQGNFEEEVIQAAGTGYLSFYYQIQLTGPKGGAIDTLEASDFTGWNTNVGVNTPYAVFAGNKGTVQPTSINVTPDGSAVNFEFGNTFTDKSGAVTSVTLVVNTNSFSYQAGSSGLIDTGVATVNSFAPGPEPGSMALFGSVLAIGALVARRRLVRR